MTRGQRAAGVLTALFLVATFIVAFYILCKVWPGGPDPVVPPPNSPADAGSITVFGQRVVLTLELRQILLAMFAGVVGNLIASLLSFASYVGNRKLTASWLPWYVLNPFIGGGIAVLFYFAYRAGLVTAGSASGVVSAYGIAAIASLSGMFSKNAADKLKEIFDVAFHAKEDAKRADKLGPLTIAAISPARFVKGSPDAEITVTGAGFVEGSVVRINGNDRKTAFVSSGTLRATLLASDFATSASLRLRVINPDGSTSGESALSVV